MTHYTMKHLICTAIALSVLWLSQNCVHGGRQEFQTNGKLLETQPESRFSDPLVQSEDVLLNRLMANANENRDAYMELKNYHQEQPNYLVKWPGLRDLLLTAVDYDNNMDPNDINDNSKGYEIANSRLMKRLQQLAETSSFTDELESTRENTGQGEIIQKNYENTGTNQLHFKNHGTKKNVQFRKQFMAPCHFKVCYMGPKRNVRYLNSY